MQDYGFVFCFFWGGAQTNNIGWGPGTRGRPYGPWWGSRDEALVGVELSGVLGVKNQASLHRFRRKTYFLGTSDSYKCIVYNYELQKSVNNCDS